MKMTYLNSIYGIFERIADFQIFFGDAARLLAGICFCMALGMMAIKVWLGGADLRGEVIKLFLTLVVYFIMIEIYPFAMKGILRLSMNLGYGAVFDGGSYDLKIENQNGKSKSDFYKWMAEATSGIFSISEEETDEEAVKQALELNIVDGETGYFDLNKTFRFIYVLFRVMWKAMPSKWQLILPTGALMMIMFLLGFLAAFVCFIMCLIQYITCLIDYFAVVGFGILMVPLSLWEGTKSYTGTLLGSIGKIFIKLLVISAFLYLSVMSFIDIFVELYVNDLKGIDAVFGYAETCLSIIFKSVILFVLTKQTTAISGFISGGNPAMSFGEFTESAYQTAAVAKTAGSGASAFNAMRQNAIRGGASAVSSGVLGGIAGGMAASAVGGGAGAVIGSALKSGAANLGGNLAQSIGSTAAEGVKKIASSNPKQALNSGAQRLGEMFGARGAVSAEGISGGPGGRYTPTSADNGGYIGNGGNSENVGDSESASSGSSSEGRSSSAASSSLPNDTSGSYAYRGRHKQSAQEMQEKGKEFVEKADMIASNAYDSRNNPYRESGYRLYGNYLKERASTTENGNQKGFFSSVGGAIKSSVQDTFANSANAGYGTKVFLSKGAKHAETIKNAMTDTPYGTTVNGSRVVVNNSAQRKAGTNNTGVNSFGKGGDNRFSVVKGAKSGEEAVRFAKEAHLRAQHSQQISNMEQ